ncbi:MAG: signal peptidase I, partial [Candidatus Hydrogenedentes bacterium]|nr:signal peptidase I [Candidatus Hydrogenedentota bacterium]
MAVSRDDIEKLHAEAKRIRKNFKYLQGDLKRLPENIDLLRQRDNLKKRYNEIQALLDQARAAGVRVPEEREDKPDGQSVDMSIFEPKPFEIPAAVHIKQRGAVSSERTRITFKDIRTIVSVVLLFFLLPFFYLYFVKNMRFYEVPTESMKSTLLPGDRIVASQPGQYARGDVVVLPDPNDPGHYLVKRLVAFEGDTVEITNGNLLINGHPIAEKYATAAEDNLSPYEVPDGAVYLLGDNRNNSEDSRAWQEDVSQTELRGRVLAIYSPAARRGWLPDASVAFSEVPAP